MSYTTNLHSNALKMFKRQLLQDAYESMMNADYKLSVAHSYQPSEVAELQKELDRQMSSFVDGMLQYKLTYKHKCPIKERQ